jgi:hypothetical protein
LIASNAIAFVAIPVFASQSSGRRWSGAEVCGDNDRLARLVR